MADVNKSAFTFRPQKQLPMTEPMKGKQGLQSDLTSALGKQRPAL